MTCAGDPHASERIGAGCANTQLSITIAQLVALREGATLEQLGEIQDAMKNVVACYHGRMALSQWMKAQLVHAIIEKKEVTPYPEFIQQMVSSQEAHICISKRMHEHQNHATLSCIYCHPQFFHNSLICAEIITVLVIQ